MRALDPRRLLAGRAEFETGAPARVVHRRRCLGEDGAAREVARLSVCSDSCEFVASTERLRPSGISPLESLFDVRTVETV